MSMVCIAFCKGQSLAVNIPEFAMISTYSTYSKTWYLFSDGLKYLFKRRNAITKKTLSDFQVASINSSILLHLAATVEGAVKALLYTHLVNNTELSNAKRNHDLDTVRLFKSQIDSLQKSSWKTLSEDSSNTILGFQLQSVYKENWQALRFLFEFRNILAHGGIIINTMDKISKELIFAKDNIETTKESLTKKDLLKYLQENKLIENIDNSKLLNWKFINNNVTDFFYFHAKSFLIKLYEEYESKYHLHYFLENDKITIQRL